MKIFVEGPPGSGKNVVAAHIADKLKIRHINYRAVSIEACSKTNKISSRIKNLIKKEKCFPPKLAAHILQEYLKTNGINDFVVDGFPKSEEESRQITLFLEKSADIYAFFINTSEQITYKRLQNRLVCPQCAYVLYDPNPDSILEISCINCHTPLIKRQDDNVAKIKERIARYQKEKIGMKKVFSKIAKTYDIPGKSNLSIIISDILDILKPNNFSLAERGARMFLEGLGLNLADPNIIGTSRRLVNSMRELMVGQYRDAYNEIMECLNTTFPTRYKGMIILDPLKCVSLCSHHLLPISYEVLFGYVPKDKSLGFSKIGKVIGLIASKPGLQEDFTQEVIETFNKILNPQGIMIVVRGKHTCMTMRGEKSDNVNITSAIRGLFKDDPTSREEFLSLASFKKNA